MLTEKEGTEKSENIIVALAKNKTSFKGLSDFIFNPLGPGRGSYWPIAEEID